MQGKVYCLPCGKWALSELGIIVSNFPTVAPVCYLVSVCLE